MWMPGWQVGRTKHRDRNFPRLFEITIHDMCASLLTTIVHGPRDCRQDGQDGKQQLFAWTYEWTGGSCDSSL
jgi:hypothetical protein